MRLLLDEHFSPRIARQLRALGHDVIAVAEQPELSGLADRVHFASSADQHRAIVTQDLGDFRPLLSDAMRRGLSTYGLVCVPSRIPLNLGAVDRLVSVLAGLLEAHPEDDAAVRRGGEIWVALDL